MLIKNITIGADPELFIVNKKTNQPVSSIGLIPGVKGDAYSEGMESGYGVQIDNVLGEFNIPPVTTKKDFIRSINTMKKWFEDYLKDKNKNLSIACKASMVYPESELTSIQAKEFGCSVDYNAYTQDANPAPEGTSTNLRSAGCHIHFGYDNFNVETSLQLIRLFDVFLGIPSVIADTDTKRRSLYGKAGCFRLTPYGFEYRTLSGLWIDNDKYLDFIWEGVFRAVDAFESGNYNVFPYEEVRKIIDNGSVLAAKRFVKTYKIPVL